MKKLLKQEKIIAKQFGVSENCAYKIEKGIRWAHVTIDDDDDEDLTMDGLEQTEQAYALIRLIILA